MKVTVRPVSNFITDQHGNPYPLKPTEIKLTVYVQRLINSGELIVITKQNEIVPEYAGEKKGKK